MKYLSFGDSGSGQYYFSITEKREGLSFSTEEKDKLLSYLKENPYILDYTSSNYLFNWKVLNTFLLSFLKQDELFNFYNTYVENIFSSTDISLLRKWYDIFSELKNEKMKNVIQERINDHINQENIVIDTEENSFIISAKESFLRKAIIPAELLTSVKITQEMAASIIVHLGNKIDISDVYDKSTSYFNIVKYLIHDRILAVLTSFGLSKTRDKKGWSINDITSVLDFSKKDKKGKDKEEIYTTLFNITQDYGDVLPELIGDSSLEEAVLKYREKKNDKNLKTLQRKVSQFILSEKEEKDLESIGKPFKKRKEEEDRIYAEIEELQKKIDKRLNEKKDGGDTKIKKYVEEIEKLKNSLPQQEKGKVLREWQKQAIDYIKAGESILINGPTGGGKTYTSMIAFDFFMKDRNTKIVYCAPNYHLVFQTYCNFKRTFPDKQASFISKVTNTNLPDTQVYFGTPSDLSVYFAVENIYFHIGLFDEIHTLSLNYGVGKLDELSSEAMSNLLGRCQRQVIALSATIHSEDIPVLQNYISERTGVRKINPVRYKKRPVELQRWIYNGEDIVEIDRSKFIEEEIEDTLTEQIKVLDINDNSVTYIPKQNEVLIPLIENKNVFPVEREREEREGNKKDFGIKDKSKNGLPIVNYEDEGNKSAFILAEESASTIENDIGEDVLSINDVDHMSIAVTPEQTFNLLNRVRDRDMLPALVFDETEKMCFDNYEKYVDWIKKEDMNNLPSWHKLKNELSTFLSSYNDDGQRISYVNDYSSALNKKYKDEEDMRKGLERIESRIRPLALRRYELRQEVLHRIQRELVDQLLHEENVKYTKKLNLTEEDKLASLLTSTNINKRNTLSYNTYSLLDEYINFERSSKQSGDMDASSLPYPFEGVSSLFRIGGRVSAISDFRAMYESNTGDTESRKIRETTEKLCKAENISLKDISSTIKLIVEGLEYGVGLLLPTLPFVIQYFILKALNETSNAAPNGIKCIFASHSMSMGINYAFRLVIIRNKRLSILNVSKYQQMGGRAGRPGLDTQAHVISWNVSNADQTTLNNLPRILLPQFGEDKGCLIPDYLSLSIQIEANRLKNHRNISLAQEMSVRKEIRQVDEDDDILYFEEKGSKRKDNDRAIKNAIKFCIEPIAEILHFSKEDILTLSRRIVEVNNGIVAQDIKENTYYYVQKVNEIKAVMQEIYVRLHNTENKVFLEYIADKFIALHKFQYVQLRV
jgi:hypothetical protein